MVSGLFLITDHRSLRQAHLDSDEAFGSGDGDREGDFFKTGRGWSECGGGKAAAAGKSGGPGAEGGGNLGGVGEAS